jgi:hypothetical protein
VPFSTGKERDPESGLDNFGARYDSSSMGRFMSPDPLYIEAHRLADPQRLNLSLPKMLFGANAFEISDIQEDEIARRFQQARM